MAKLKWIKEEDEPYYVSKCGRFNIDALYLGGSRPQGWEIIDHKTNKHRKTYCDLDHAKNIAEEMNKGPGPAASKEGWVIIHPNGEWETSYFNVVNFGSHKRPGTQTAVEWRKEFRPNCEIVRMKLTRV